MKIQILNVTVITRNEFSTDIDVECRIDGVRCRIGTDIREGRDVPDGEFLNVTGHPPVPEETIVALHEALDVQAADVMAAEMARICGE